MRELKATKAEKALVKTNVDVLLQLKKDLASLEQQATSTSNPSTSNPSLVDIENLSKNVTQQVITLIFDHFLFDLT